MATIESHATTGFTTVSSPSDSITITKPAGLTEGEYLFAFVGIRRTSAAGSYSTPSGWTLLEDTGNNSNNWRMYCFYKEAEASDVSASDFTFNTSSGGSLSAVGSLLRISSFGNIQDSNSGTGTALTNSLSGFDRTNSLNLIVGVIGGATAISSYAYATDNPTWTERFDINDGSTNAHAVAYADRPETTDTGNASFSGGTGAQAIINVAIAPQVNSSITADIPDLEMNIQAFFIGVFTRMELGTPELKIQNKTPWVNEDEADTTWTNET